MQDTRRNKREQDPSKGARDVHRADAQLKLRSIPDVAKHLRCQARSCDAPCRFSTVGEVLVLDANSVLRVCTCESIW